MKRKTIKKTLRFSSARTLKHRTHGTGTQRPSSMIKIRKPNDISTTRMNTQKLALGGTITSFKSTKAKEKLSFPMDPEKCLSVYSHLLSIYDQKALLTYKKIYYINTTNINCDFSKGDHIAYRYEVTGKLGTGRHGRVFECFDHKSKQSIAVKVLRGTGDHLELARTEINILQSLNRWDFNDDKHIVQMKRSFEFNNHVCIVLEILENSLANAIYSVSMKGLPSNAVKKYAKQILKGLDYIRKFHVTHNDINPSNFMFTESSDIKIIDFSSGSAEVQPLNLQQYIYYKAPEVILGLQFSIPIDIWSFGCVLFEMYKGYPIFPGRNETEVLMLIIDTIGEPPAGLLEQIKQYGKPFQKHVYGTYERNLYKELGKDKNLTDLILRCILWDPKRRITPKQALMHPWLNKTI